MLSDANKFSKEGLTFDDVLLIPGESDVTPNMIQLGTTLAGKVKLKTPIMTSAMDTVTESKWRSPLPERAVSASSTRT